MDFALNEVQRMLQESTSAYLAGMGGGARKTARSPNQSPRNADDWAGIAQLGWLALQLPEELGGMDGGPLEIMIVMQAFGQAGVLEPFLSTAVIGARAISRYGSEAQRSELLPRLAEGRLRIALACHEDRAGCLPAAIATRAAPERDSYFLHGRKPCVLDAETADKLLVAARIEGDERGEIGFFLVDSDAIGLDCRHFARLDGGPASHLELDAVHVRGADRVGIVGQGPAILADLTRLSIAALCAEAVGAMQALHDRTLEYLKMRKQFGRPIGQFQVLQHRQVDMLVALEQARSIVMAASMALAENLPAADDLLSMAKITIGRAGRVIAQGAVQLHGGIGMSAELGIGAYFKRLAVIDTLCGSADQHLRILAGLRSAAA